MIRVLCPRTVEEGETDRGERSSLKREEGGKVPGVNLRALSTDRSGGCVCGSAGSGIPIFRGALCSRTLWEDRT